MGVEALLIAGAGLNLLGGVSALQESKQQARQAQVEATQQAEERKKEVQRTIARNTALFAKSGISLEGSPLFGIEQDIQTGVEDTGAILESGAARARSLRAQGRTAFLGSIGRATDSITQLASVRASKAPKKQPKEDSKKKQKKQSDALEF